MWFQPKVLLFVGISKLSLEKNDMDVFGVTMASKSHTMKFVNSFARSQHLYDTVATLIHVDSIFCHILLSCCLVPVPVGWCLTALSAQKRLYHAMGE